MPIAQDVFSSSRSRSCRFLPIPDRLTYTETYIYLVLYYHVPTTELHAIESSQLTSPKPKNFLAFTKYLPAIAIWIPIHQKICNQVFFFSPTTFQA